MRQHSVRSPIGVISAERAGALSARVVSPVALAALLVAAVTLRADPVPVHHTEGIVHGFLVLRTLDGRAIANGDLVQRAAGNRVTSRLTFHFSDGSLHDETAVFSQRGAFRLISDHLVQKGPAFPESIDMTIDVARGRVRVDHGADDGARKTEDEHMDLPADLANGLILTLLKNVSAGSLPKSFSFVAATPKPRLVKLALSDAGQDAFSTGSEGRRATHYVLKVEIGGLSGLLAPLVGKQPPDSHVWILGGDAPTFVKAEQPLYTGGPLWRIELVSPVGPRGNESGPR